MEENEYFDLANFNEEDQKLKENTPYGLPNNPSDQNLPAEYIRAMEYMGYFLLHEWLEKLRKTVGDNNTATLSLISNLDSALKMYSDNNLETAKSYADTKKTEANSYTDQEVGKEKNARESADNIMNGEIGSMLVQISQIFENISSLNTNVDEKLDANGGTISNDLTILGNLFVRGTSSEVSGTAIKINDALVVTNADGIRQNEGLIGYVTVINNNATDNAYGIIYSNGNLELGLGTYSNGSFTFKTGENFPLALHDSYMANNNFVKWDSARKIFVDSGVDADFYVTFYNTLNNLKTTLENAETGRDMAEFTRNENEQARQSNESQRVSEFESQMNRADAKIDEIDGKIRQYSELVTTKSTDMSLSEFESITPVDDTYYFVYEE